LCIADTFRDGKFEKKFCSDEKTAIFLLPYCTYSSLQQLSRKCLLVLLELSHYRSRNVMDYESNFGNIKKMLRLPNLLGASEVLPTYVVSKKGQNIHVLHAAPQRHLHSRRSVQGHAWCAAVVVCAGACLVCGRRCLCRCAACVVRNPKSGKRNF
jgi:hypothetical protein